MNSTSLRSTIICRNCFKIVLGFALVVIGSGNAFSMQATRAPAPLSGANEKSVQTRIETDDAAVRIAAGEQVREYKILMAEYRELLRQGGNSAARKKIRLLIEKADAIPVQEMRASRFLNAHLEHARFHIQQGGFETALDAINSIVEDIEERQYNTGELNVMRSLQQSLEKMCRMNDDSRAQMVVASRYIGEVDLNRLKRIGLRTVNADLELFESLLGEDDLFTINAFFQRTLLEFSARKREKSEENLRLAIEKYDALLGAGSLSAIRARNWLASALGEIDYPKNLVKALGEAKRALREHEKLFGHEVHPNSLRLHKLLSKIQTARVQSAGVRFYLANYIRIAEQVNGPEDVEVAFSRFALAIELNRINDPQKAMELISQSIDVLETHGSEAQLAFAMERRAYGNMTIGDHKNAAADYRESLRLAGDKSVLWERVQRTVYCALNEAKAGETDSAKSLLAWVEESFEYDPGNPMDVLTMILIGWTWTEVGMQEKGAGIMEDAFARLPNGRRTGLFSLAREQLAEILISRGRVADGKSHLMRIMHEKTVEFRTYTPSMQDHQVIVQSAELQLAFQKICGITDFDNKDEVVNLALVGAETKGLMTNSLAERIRMFRESGDEQALSTYDECRLQLDSMIIRNSLTNRSADDEAIDEMEFLNRYKFDEIASNLPASGIARPHVVKQGVDGSLLKRFNSLLVEGEAIVDFAIGDATVGDEKVPSYYCFVYRLDKDQKVDVSAVRIGSAKTINEDVLKLRKSMGIAGGRGLDVVDPQMNESKKLALKIRETVWDPVRKKLGDCKKIYISPVNFLANVPWAGLPGSEKGRYLVHEFTFVHGDDPISILEAKALQPFREKPRFVLMGGIDYGPADTAAGLSWSALNGSQSEIAGIQSHLKSADCRLISGQTGSESELLRQLKDASRPLFLHLAVHGFALESERYTTPSTELSELSFRQSKLPILERHPFSMTGVVLAGANRSFSVDVPYGEDGYFSGESLIGLDLGHVEMVVLSACDSGRGQVALGEGTFGIRKPLRIAGVRTVVSSLWKAHDDVTRQLMVEFYKNLVNGKSKAESLQLAQVALAAKYPPALWASWQIDGDSR